MGKTFLEEEVQTCSHTPNAQKATGKTLVTTQPQRRRWRNRHVSTLLNPSKKELKSFSHRKAFIEMFLAPFGHPICVKLKGELWADLIAFNCQ